MQTADGHGWAQQTEMNGEIWGVNWKIGQKFMKLDKILWMLSRMPKL